MCSHSHSCPLLVCPSHTYAEPDTQPGVLLVMIMTRKKAGAPSLLSSRHQPVFSSLLPLPFLCEVEKEL